jgi:hypothetical protein
MPFFASTWSVKCGSYVKYDGCRWRFLLHLALSLSIFPFTIKPLHSLYPWVFSGTLVAIYMLSRTWSLLYFLQKWASPQGAFGKRGIHGKRRSDMLGTILIVVLILMLLGALPTWPHSRQWGYYPSGLLGLILLILIILILLGRF